MKKMVIGALHFPPLSGYADNPGFDIAQKNAFLDTKNLEEGGATHIIIENNYDIPHTIKVTDAVVKDMIALGKIVKQNTHLPIGVSVLWNDYENAFKIAKEIGATFIRIPVFVDEVKTDCGIIKGTPDDVISFRKKINAENIKIFADIHVKHATLLSSYSLEESAKLAVEKSADVLIVTGKWTGDAPLLEDIIKVKKVVNTFPVICGSGVTAENVQQLFSYADGAIISTSLKEASDIKHTQNIKPYEARIDIEKVKELVSKI